MGKKSRSKRQAHAGNKPVQKQQEQTTPALSQETALGARLANPTASSSNQTRGVQADYAYVRSDIRRILIFLVAIIAVLAAVTIVNVRSTVLKNTGSKMAHFFQLEQ